MASDVLSAVATAVVSALGIGFTYKAGERQTETALRVSREQNEATLAAQREERLQRRLEMAYQELLQHLMRTWDWVRSVYPMFTRTPEEYTMPPLPAEDDPIRAEALFSSMWSPRVQQLVKARVRSLDSVYEIAVRLGMLKQYPEIREPDEEIPELRLRAAKEAVWKADSAIREQIWRELRGGHDGTAEPEDAEGPAVD
jgi:hypothetical protein